MAKISLADVLELSVSERIQLVEDIGDSLASHPESISLTEAQRVELDRRLEDYHLRPDEGTSWETLKEHILGQV